MKAGPMWEDTGLVFTNELGHNLSAQTVYLHFKKLAERAGFPGARFHDVRHSSTKFDKFTAYYYFPDISLVFSLES